MAQRQGKGKIDWCDFSWNPIKGKCGYDCPYCYMKEMRNRFPLNEELRLDAKELAWIPPARSKIFVCSSLDIMHPAVPRAWINEVIETMAHNLQSTYLLLTKNPRKYAKWKLLPANVWMGTTVDGLPFTEANFYDLKIVPPYGVKGARKFVSFEPLVDFPHAAMDMEAAWYNFGWIIIGGDSSKGAEKPPDEWADELISKARFHDIPVFVKDNYKYHTVIKEFPQGEKNDLRSM